MKSLSAYHPVDSVRTLVDIDRLIDSFFGSPASAGTSSLSKYPVVDIRETNDSYIVDAALPGYDDKDVEVNLDGMTLTIESKQDNTDETTAPEKNYIIRERHSEHFSRSFKLPENADPTQISADFKNGLLTLYIKKRTEAQKRIIDINSKKG